MKLSSGKLVAAWSTSVTSKASLSSGQIVGPLWTWMFLIPSSSQCSQERHGLGILQRPAARAAAATRPCRASRPGGRSARGPPRSWRRPASPSRGSQRPLTMSLPGKRSSSAAFCSMSLKPVRVPLACRYVDWKIAWSTWPSVKTSFSKSSIGVLLEVLERPVRLGRPEPLVGVEALDPALGVLLLALHPVRRARVPEVQVAVDDEVLLAVLLVHGYAPLTGCRSKPMYSAASSGLANIRTRSSSTTMRP